MEVDQPIRERVLDAVSARLPPEVTISRQGRSGLVVSSKSTRSGYSSTRYPAFSHLPRLAPSRYIAMTTARCVIDTVVRHISQHDLQWPGLSAGRITVDVRSTDEAVFAALTDGAGATLEFPPIRLAVPTLPALDRAALLDEVVAAESPIDSVARWLLRVGIDHSGELTLNILWDVAVRAGVLADLMRSGRLVETADSVHVDAELTGTEYEDAACQDLLAHVGMTPAVWIRKGRLRAIDVADDLLDRGEWTAHRAPLSPGMRKYRTDKRQHIPLRKRLAYTYDGALPPVTDEEAALAVLGHALNIVRPRRIKSTEPETALQAHGCGTLADLVAGAQAELVTRTAAAKANGNPTYTG